MDVGYRAYSPYKNIVQCTISVYVYAYYTLHIYHILHIPYISGSYRVKDMKDVIDAALHASAFK